jgi:uncharacterized phiE125 gp8 family phage protein
MLSAAPMMLSDEAAAEAKAYLRIVGADEDALAARLMRAAAEYCERFTGQALVAREFTEVVAASGVWTRLGATPVRAILGVEALPDAGEPLPIGAGGYAVDIDAGGDGWVRVTDAGGAKRTRIRFEAGLAADWSDIPEALRQGAIRLAAHLYVERGGEAGPPAAVTALWRPFRRMRLR